MKTISVNNEIEPTNSSSGNYLIRTKVSGIGCGGFEWVTTSQEYFMTKKQANEFLKQNYKLIK